MTTQARSSFLPSEILWGHRFDHMVKFKKETGEYEVDYNAFNSTYEVDTPLCSSRQLDEIRNELHSPQGLGNFFFLNLHMEMLNRKFLTKYCFGFLLTIN